MMRLVTSQLARRTLRSAVWVAVAASTFSTMSTFAQSAAPASASVSSKMSPAAGKGMMKSDDMKKSMTSMQEKMSGMAMSGNQDMDFAMMMKIHHEGAIEMARAELDHGKDPTMRSAAKKIISAQKTEIAEFDRWMSHHRSVTPTAMPK